MPTFNRKTKRPSYLPYTLLATLACTATLYAANITDTWDPALTTGNWSIAANWSAALPGTDPASLYDIQIQSASTSQSILYDLPTSPANLNSLTIDATNNHTTAFSLTDNNTLTIQNIETIGQNGNATFLQTAGTNSVGVLVLANNHGSNATYTLGDTLGSNPTLISKTAEEIGGSGNATFTQYSGNNIAINLFLGFSASATYNLAGGNLTLAGGLFLGDYVSPVSANFLQTGGNLTVNAGYTYPEFVGYNTSANFSQLAGNHTVASDLNVGFNYTISTPSTSLPSIYILGDTTGDSPTLSIAGNLTIGNNANGSFTQYSGNLTTAGLFLATTTNSKAAFTLSGGNFTITTSPLYINQNAFLSNTTFLQNGGTLTLNGGPLFVGYVTSSSTTLYTQTGGSLVANAADATNVSEYIGYAAPTNFTQTNGTNTAAHDLVVGPASVTYILGNTTGANPTLTVLGSERIGASSTNAFTQYSGNNLTTNLYLGNANPGNYTLNGGNLSISSNLYLAYRYNNFPNLLSQNAGNLFAASEYIGYNGSGNYNHINGNNTLSANLYISFADSLPTTFGTYTLGNTTGASPSLTVSGTEYIGYATSYQISGTFTQYSGNNTTGSLTLGGGNVGATGNYSLLGGNLTLTSGPLSISAAGSAGTSTFLQSAGNIFANATDPSGFSESIGINSLASFIQSGGNNSLTGNLALAPTYSATYTINNPSASLNIQGNAYLGSPRNFSSKATFNLSAGNVSITGTLKIYPTNNSSFNLSGGSLSLSTLDLSNTPSLLHWTSGNLTINNNTNLGPFFSDPTSKSLGTSLSLNANQSFTIIGDESIAAFALTLASGASHAVTGNLTLYTNAVLTLSPNSSLSYANLTMYDNATINGTFTNSSNFFPRGGYINGTFINNGLASFNTDTGSPISCPLSVISNAQTFFNTPQHLNSLSIQSGTTYLANGPSITNSFSLAGSTNAWIGTLNLFQSSLIINDLTPHAPSIATLENQIAYAQTHTTGITADIDPAHAIIILDNAVANLSTFQNIPVDSHSIIITTALIGDFNLDGTVDINDLTLIANHWQKPVSDYSQGDFDNNKIVDILDLTAVANHWQTTSAITASIRPSFAPAPSSSSPTPEPSTLALLFLSATPLLKRKR